MKGDTGGAGKPVGFIVLYGSESHVRSEVIWSGESHQVELAQDELARIIREVLVGEDY